MKNEFIAKECPKCNTKNIIFGYVITRNTFMCSECRFELKVVKTPYKNYNINTKEKGKMK